MIFYTQIFFAFCLELGAVLFFDYSIIYPVRVLYLSWLFSRERISLPAHVFTVLFFLMTSLVHGCPSMMYSASILII